MSIINKTKHLHVNNVVVTDNPNDTKYKDWYAVKPTGNKESMNLPDSDDITDILIGKPGEGDGETPSQLPTKLTTDMVTCVNIRNKDNELFPMSRDLLTVAINKLSAQIMELQKSSVYDERVNAVERENAELRKEIEALKEQLNGVSLSIVDDTLMVTYDDGTPE